MPVSALWCPGFKVAGWGRENRQRTASQVQPALEQNTLWRSVQAPPCRYAQSKTLVSSKLSCLFPAAICFAPFSAAPPEGANFCNILDKAVQADQVVKERNNAHCEMIGLLCKPENELNAAIPSASPTKTLQGSEVRAPLTCFNPLDHVNIWMELFQSWRIFILSPLSTCEPLCPLWILLILHNINSCKVSAVTLQTFCSSVMHPPTEVAAKGTLHQMSWRNTCNILINDKRNHKTHLYSIWNHFSAST